VLSSSDISTAQALADAATITLLQAQTTRRTQRLTAQLQGALNSRMTVEQAKVRLPSGPRSAHEAFATLRGYARDHDAKLTEVAAAFVEGSLPAALVSR